MVRRRVTGMRGELPAGCRSPAGEKFPMRRKNPHCSRIKGARLFESSRYIRCKMG